MLRGQCSICGANNVLLHEIYQKDGKVSINTPVRRVPGMISFPAYVGCDECTRKICDKYGKEYPEWGEELIG